jgi:hypothetical protein
MLRIVLSQEWISNQSKEKLIQGFCEDLQLLRLVQLLSVIR